MRLIKYTVIFFAAAALFSCSLFLGQDPENNPKAIFDSIWNDFDKTYALFEVKHIDWKAVYNSHIADIYSGMSDKELFTVCCEMLGELDDSHALLNSPFDSYNSGGRFSASNMEIFSLELIKNDYLTDYKTAGNGMFTYGKFKPELSVNSIGYIYISGFANGENTGGSQDWIKAIDGIISSLGGTDSLVLDVRGNRGGLSANVDYIASRFASQTKDYAQVRTRDGPGRSDFSAPVNFTIKPDGTRYTKPIAFITNAQTISAGEWFTLALLSQDHVTHFGSTTCGAFSLSLSRFLINGWNYTVSVQKVTDMDGICYEDTGISPAVITANTAENIDDQLEEALSFLTIHP